MKQQRTKQQKDCQVAILGASGYVGAELMRYLVDHPNFQLTYIGAKTSAGQTLADLYPHLAMSYPNFKFQSLELDEAGLGEAPELPDIFDVIFLALPHGQAGSYINQIWDKAEHIVDLAADFRLPTDIFESTYQQEHYAPKRLSEFVAGIPEFFSKELQDAKAAAVPGCYTTAAVMALKPLLDAGVVKSQKIIVDAASGVSGAGKTPTDVTTFGNVQENFFAYKLGNHRHTPEMEQLLKLSPGELLFTPHLAPMNRGILATCYSELTDEISDPSSSILWECYKSVYEDAPFVHLFKAPDHLQDEATNLPATKNTLGSNAVHLYAQYEARTKTVITLSAIDNLGKGAAGQAVQCANLMCGIDETAGLTISGRMP